MQDFWGSYRMNFSYQQFNDFKNDMITLFRLESCFRYEDRFK